METIYTEPESKKGRSVSSIILWFGRKKIENVKK